MPSPSLPLDYIRSVLEVIDGSKRAIGLDAPEKVTVAPGLSDLEVRGIQTDFGFVFPPDLRALLSVGLPLGQGFPDWRSASRQEIRKRLDAPTDGVLFDVEVNKFWYPAWGSRPPRIADALARAKERIADAPRLVPVYSHRYMPCEPAEDGNPVFSVMQTDIIYYGNDLADYLASEFGARRPPWARTDPKGIRFWSDIVDMNNGSVGG